MKLCKYQQCNQMKYMASNNAMKLAIKICKFRRLLNNAATSSLLNVRINVWRFRYDGTNRFDLGRRGQGWNIIMRSSRNSFRIQVRLLDGNVIRFRRTGFRRFQHFAISTVTFVISCTDNV